MYPLLAEVEEPNWLSQVSWLLDEASVVLKEREVTLASEALL
jgi:hypothetical protein